MRHQTARLMTRAASRYLGGSHSLLTPSGYEGGVNPSLFVAVVLVVAGFLALELGITLAITVS